VLDRGVVLALRRELEAGVALIAGLRDRLEAVRNVWFPHALLVSARDLGDGAVIDAVAVAHEVLDAGSIGDRLVVAVDHQTRVGAFDRRQDVVAIVGGRQAVVRVVAACSGS
jgi:hypothetical protein